MKPPRLATASFVLWLLLLIVAAVLQWRHHAAREFQRSLDSSWVSLFLEKSEPLPVLSPPGLICFFVSCAFAIVGIVAALSRSRLRQPTDPGFDSAP